MTAHRIKDYDGPGEFDTSDADEMKLSDYKKVKEGAKLVEAGYYERTEVIKGEDEVKYYVHPPETSEDHPLEFESKRCNIVPEDFECTRCGVSLGYCLTHKAIHCGCGYEVRNGRRIVPPLRYSFYHPTYCQRIPPMFMQCSKCGTYDRFCRYHRRVHCGCNERTVED